MIPSARQSGYEARRALLARLMNGDLAYRRRDGWTEFELTLPLGEMPALVESLLG
jgi:hypothetical protein